MLFKILVPVILSLTFSGCVVRPADHHHADRISTPVYPVVTSVTQTHVQRNIIRYRSDCDLALSRNHYVPACDEYLQITSAPHYERNNEIVQTRLRFLRHQQRYAIRQNQRQHVPNQLVNYQRQCDAAIARQQYVPACDQYIQLSAAPRYTANSRIHSMRNRYMDYKKRYKKSLRNIRMYKKPQKHSSAENVSAPVKAYTKYKKSMPNKNVHVAKKGISEYQHRCDRALSQKNYSPACDNYLQLTNSKNYHADKKVKKLRKRYWQYKKQYKHD